MGCASSTPLMNGSAGLVGAAKHAASDVTHAGEEALNDIGDGVNGTVGHVKDAVVGAVHGIGQGLDGVLHSAADGAKGIATDAEARTTAALTSATDTVTEYTHIPLRDPNKMDEHLEDFKETLLKKAQSFSDDTEQLADDLIKDTEDVATAAADTVKSTADILDISNTALGKHSTDGNDDTTSIHSLDSLRTTSPEPEIEKALSNVDATRKKPPSPEPTFNEMTEIAGDLKRESKEESNEVQQYRHVANKKHPANPPNDADKVLIEKYTKLFTTPNPPVPSQNKYGNHSYPSDTGDILGLNDNNNTGGMLGSDARLLLNGGSSNNNAAGNGVFEDGDDRTDPMPLTQWELLADAILATPVTRFTDNPVYPTISVQPDAINHIL